MLSLRATLQLSLMLCLASNARSQGVDISRLPPPKEIQESLDRAYGEYASHRASRQSANPAIADTRTMMVITAFSDRNLIDTKALTDKLSRVPSAIERMEQTLSGQDVYRLSGSGAAAREFEAASDSLLDAGGFMSGSEAFRQPGLRSTFKSAVAVTVDLMTEKQTQWAIENDVKFKANIVELSQDRPTLYARLAEIYREFPQSREMIDAFISPDMGLSPGRSFEILNEAIDPDIVRQWLEENGTSGNEVFTDKQRKAVKEATDLAVSLAAQGGFGKPTSPRSEARLKKALETIDSLELSFRIAGVIAQVADPKTSQTMAKVGDPSFRIARSLLRLTSEKLTTTTLRMLSLDLVGAVSDLLGALLGGPSEIEVLRQSLNELREEVQQFRKEMHERLNIIDSKLDTLLIRIDQSFEKVLQKIDGVASDVEDLKLSVAALSRQNFDYQVRIETMLREAMEEKGTDKLRQCLSYKDRHQSAMTDELLQQCLDTAFQCAVSHSQKTAAIGGVRDPLLIKGDAGDVAVTEIGRKLSSPVGFDPLAHGHLLKAALAGLELSVSGSDALANEVVPNLRLWSECAQAYVTLATQHWDSFLRLKTPFELRQMRAFGAKANDLHASLLFETNDEGAWLLNQKRWEGLKTLHESSIDRFALALRKSRSRIEEAQMGGIDTTMGADQKEKGDAAIAGSPLLDATVPSTMGICRGVDENHLREHGTNNSFSLNVHPSIRQALLSKIPGAVKTAIRMGVGRLEWCIVQFEWQEGIASKDPNFTRIISDAGRQGSVAGVWESLHAKPAMQIRLQWFEAQTNSESTVSVASFVAADRVHVWDRILEYRSGVHVNTGEPLLKHRVASVIKDYFWPNFAGDMSRYSMNSVGDEVNRITTLVSSRLEDQRKLILSEIFSQVNKEQGELGVEWLNVLATVRMSENLISMAFPKDAERLDALMAFFHGTDGVLQAGSFAEFMTTKAYSEIFDESFAKTMRQRSEDLGRWLGEEMLVERQAHPLISETIGTLEMLDLLSFDQPEVAQSP